MVILKHKLKAATLIEVLTAITLMMIGYAVFVLVFFNNNEVVSKKKLKALLVTEQYMAGTLEENSYFDEEIQESGIIIQKTIDQYGSSKHLLMISISALDEGSKKTIFERKFLVSVTK